MQRISKIEKPKGGNSESLKALLKDVRKYKKLSEEKEAELFHSIKQGGTRGERAKNELARSVFKMVKNIAENYIGSGVPLDELVAYGNLGLSEALCKFDPARGKRFLSFATPWIQGAIIRGMNEYSRFIHLPAHHVPELMRYRKKADEWFQATGREITLEEYLQFYVLDKDLLRDILATANKVTSLEERLNNSDEGSECLLDVLDDDDFYEPAEKDVENEFDLRRVSEELGDILTCEEKNCIFDYSATSGLKLSLTEIAKKRNSTVSHVRYVLMKALKKIQQHHDADRITKILFNL